jgi:ubiquinone/menaquinone biosynthesis C-methylase UbiE
MDGSATKAYALVLACLAVLVILLAVLLRPHALVVGAAILALTAGVAGLAGVFGPCDSVRGAAGGGAVGGRPRRTRRARFRSAAAAPAGLFAQVRQLAGSAAGEQILRRARRFFDGLGRGFGRIGIALIMRAGSDDDAAVLAHMRSAWLAHGGAAVPPDKCRGRGQARIADIPAFAALAAVRAAARDDPTFEYLDVGSAEGCITAAVAEYLGLPRSRAHACDIVAQPPSEAFEFARTDGRSLPFTDGEFAFVTMFMSAHHFADADRVFAEAFRVARSGAALLMREHGRAAGAAQGHAQSLYYDLVHAFYETVYRVEATPAEFAAHYAAGHFAQYRTAEDWVRVGARAGFELVEKSEPRDDKFDTVYLLLRKP